MKHIYTLICNDILTDKESGSTTYYKAIDQIMTNGIPVALPSLAVGSYWELVPDQKKVFSVRIKIIPPGNGQTREAIISKVPKTNSRHRVNVRFMNVVFAVEGNYTIIIETSENNEKTWKAHNEIILPLTLTKNEDELEH
ncbi:MAG: hypothetical protein HOE30_12495 [Deltaproteobacteria bacterium]|jgi:hypothetical protein|nr:hypothetical protein [Deltaproteobacteria bacterium]MBT7039217.1 hypothetical protein [Bacteroidota bacterium]MBT4264089.1 hypothetical protein [Deltaproteobacteria bacterium]MBT4638655.1 hypothetical protein [Deltaproteobacteria bacterium]MBT6614416.1 hypothetical protein [Deltaproteobacteria bacterium]